MTSHDNPYQLSKSSVSGHQSEPSLRTTPRGAVIKYTKPDGKEVTAFVNSIEGDEIKLYNKDRNTGKYINWTIKASQVRNLRIEGQVRQTSAPAAQQRQQMDYDPQQQQMPQMQQMQQPQQIPQQSPYPMPQQIPSPYPPYPMYPPVSSMLARDLDERSIEKRIDELVKKYDSEILTLRGEISELKKKNDQLNGVVSSIYNLMQSKFGKK